jgi:hypothetical protein
MPKIIEILIKGSKGSGWREEGSKGVEIIGHKNSVSGRSANHDLGPPSDSDNTGQAASSRETGIQSGFLTRFEHAEHVLSNSDNHDFIEEYAKEMRQNWRDVCSSIGRTVSFIVLLAGAFELLSRAAIAKASIGPFEIKDLSLVQKILPVFIAYFFYDLGNLYYQYSQFWTVHELLMKATHKDFQDADLDMYLEPRVTSIYHPAWLRREYDRPLHYFTTLIWFVGLFGITAFVVYAFYRNFRLYGFGDTLNYISLGVAILFMSFGTYLR